jgi:hypothetical protein
MKQMLVIRANGQIAVKPYNDGIEEIQQIVGGYVEVVGLDNNTSLWVNEEGKCIGLHPNLFATRLWEKFHGRTDIVVGDVAILGGTDEDGNSMGCPQNVIDEVRSWASAMEPTVRVYGW